MTYFPNKCCKRCGSHFFDEFYDAHLCRICGFMKDKPRRYEDIYDPELKRWIRKAMGCFDMY